MIRKEHKCSENHDYSVKGDGLTKRQKEFILNELGKGAAKAAPLDIFGTLSNMNDDDLKAMQLYNNDGVNIPSLPAIQTFIKNSNRDIAALRNHINVAKAKCEEMSAVPEDVDQPFVLAYQIKSNKDFNIVISTRRLLQKFDESARRNLDGTYKLLKSGYPVLVMGLDDANRKYHPAILSVSATEKGKKVPSTRTYLLFVSVAFSLMSFCAFLCLVVQTQTFRRRFLVYGGRPVKTPACASF